MELWSAGIECKKAEALAGADLGAGEHNCKMNVFGCVAYTSKLRIRLRARLLSLELLGGDYVLG
jgi:hypothetical protein